MALKVNGQLAHVTEYSPHPQITASQKHKFCDGSMYVVRRVSIYCKNLLHELVT